MASGHDKIETNIGLMIILIIITVSIGGLVQIVPLFFQQSTTEPVAGLEPYSPLRLAGRDVYVREGCYLCHSQMIRPFRAETERYGHFRSPANSSTTGHSSGARNAPVRTWRALVVVTAMNGTGYI